MKPKSIQLTFEEWNKLSKIKNDNNFKTMNDAFKHILSLAEDEDLIECQCIICLYRFTTTRDNLYCPSCGCEDSQCLVEVQNE